VQSTNQVLIHNRREEGVFSEGQNMGSLAVDCDGILLTTPSPHLTPSSRTFSFRGSVSLPFFTPDRFDDGILSTPHFSTRLFSPPSLKRSVSSPRRSGPPQKASSTPVSRSTPSTLSGAHPLSFSPLPSPPLPPSSPHQPPVLASIPFPSSPLCPQFSAMSSFNLLVDQQVSTPHFSICLFSPDFF